MRLQETYLFYNERGGVKKGARRSAADRLHRNRAAARFPLLAVIHNARADEQLRAVAVGVEIFALQRAAKDLPGLAGSFADVEDVDVLRRAIGV